MPAPILSSPFLNLNIINSLLSPKSNQSQPSPTERVQLLSAKLHLLTHTASESSSTNSERVARAKDPTEVLGVRLELARAHLALEVPDLRLAEVELSFIETTTRAITKRIKGRRKVESNLKVDEDGLASVQERGRDVVLDGDWFGEMKRIRVEALRLLVDVERGLGREGRARRWRELIESLECDELG